MAMIMVHVGVCDCLLTSAAATTRPGAVLADLLPAATATRARVRDAALVAGGAALTGIAAQIAVPVPGSPVPVTGQTFAALLVGAGLGARRGFLALALYAAAGMAGMPWFAEAYRARARKPRAYPMPLLRTSAGVRIIIPKLYRAHLASS